MENSQEFPISTDSSVQVQSTNIPEPLLFQECSGEQLSTKNPTTSESGGNSENLNEDDDSSSNQPPLGSIEADYQLMSQFGIIGNDEFLQTLVEKANINQNDPFTTSWTYNQRRSHHTLQIAYQILLAILRKFKEAEGQSELQDELMKTAEELIHAQEACCRSTYIFLMVKLKEVL